MGRSDQVGYAALGSHARHGQSVLHGSCAVIHAWKYVTVEINQWDSPLFRANKIILSYHVEWEKTSIEGGTCAFC